MPGAAPAGAHPAPRLNFFAPQPRLDGREMAHLSKRGVDRGMLAER